MLGCALQLCGYAMIDDLMVNGDDLSKHYIASGNYLYNWDHKSEPKEDQELDKYFGNDLIKYVDALFLDVSSKTVHIFKVIIRY